MKQYLKDNSISTGYNVLDEYTGGLTKGELTVVASRKCEGKSTFLTNITKYVGHDLNIPVLYIDTEMRSEEWGLRFASCVSGIDERRISNNRLNDFEKQKIKDILKKMKHRKIYHMYMPGYTFDKVVALVNKYYKSDNIGLVVFDQLKEPTMTEADYSRTENEIIGEVTAKLKNLAMDMNIPILTATHLNINNEIGDSEYIVRYSDMVYFWNQRTNEEYKQLGADGGSHKLWIPYNRNGVPTDENGIGYNFYKETLTIKEVDRREKSADIRKMA